MTDFKRKNELLMELDAARRALTSALEKLAKTEEFNARGQSIQYMYFTDLERRLREHDVASRERVLTAQERILKAKVKVNDALAKLKML